MKQQAALLQVNRAAGRVERENGAGSHAGDGLILGHQFRARSHAGAQNVRHGQDVIDGGGLRALFRGGNDLDVIDDLRELGLFQVGGRAGPFSIYSAQK
jgi:hypothetical protein